MNFSVTILGSSSAIPTRDRFPTSQLVTCYGRYYLLDCGEGAQIQLRKYKISFQRIDRIFISHLHADHFLGLPGLLSTMGLLGRTKEIHIHAFPELEIYMQAYTNITKNGFGFPVFYHSIEPKQDALLFENEHITIHTFPVKHSIPCHAFRFTEKPRKKNILPETIRSYNPGIGDILRLKAGEDLVLEDGTIIPNEKLTLSPPPPRSYAFVTDTAYDEKILPYIDGVDVLYHEATFAEDMKDRAKATRHSTAIQAATIALKAGVKKLVLGHYSVRYHDLEPILKEATSVFENTICSEEGMEINI